MTKKVFSVAVAALALFILNVPLQAVTASATNAPLGNHMLLGNQDIGQPIKGDLERTIQFEVVPGEEFTFDMTLSNTEEIENTANVLLRLDLPTEGQRVFFNDDITLDGMETFTYHYAEVIPEELHLYGRYTMQLFINDILADFFQFDMNSRSEITVRWDDGVMVNAYCWYDAGNKWAIRGCMPDGAVIDEIGTYLLSENDPYWPWPDSEHQPIELHLYNDDGGGGYPGTLLYNSGEVYVDPNTSECTAFPGIAAPGGAFFVATNQLQDYPGCEGQGVDGALDHWDQMWAEIGGAWQPYSSISGDLMMWAIGHVGISTITFGTPPVE